MNAFIKAITFDICFIEERGQSGHSRARKNHFQDTMGEDDTMLDRAKNQALKNVFQDISSTIGQFMKYPANHHDEMTTEDGHTEEDGPTTGEPPQDGSFHLNALTAILCLLALPMLVHSLLPGTKTQDEEQEPLSAAHWRSNLVVPTALAAICALAALVTVLRSCGDDHDLEVQREELEDKARLYGVLMLSAGALFGFLSSVSVSKMLVFRPCDYCGFA